MECREGEKVGFSEGLEQIDSAVKTMSSMLNRFNHATIFIGVDKTGRPLGRTLSEDDFPIIEAKIREKLNRMPKYSTEIGS